MNDNDLKGKEDTRTNNFDRKKYLCCHAVGRKVYCIEFHLRPILRPHKQQLYVVVMLIKNDGKSIFLQWVKGK